jgi:hypothetical protein
MNQTNKIIIGITLVVAFIASLLLFEIKRLRDDKEELKRQYRLEHSQDIADSVITLKKEIEDLKHKAIKNYIKTENLKTNRNETINNIDTMSNDDLYRFFSEQY